ncbi:MAG TPA: hypothetical protein VG937_15855 [Polyangiaceae bacterium]|nr:hypothetical protein [Polyangiaceae bacterium]
MPTEISTNGNHLPDPKRVEITGGTITTRTSTSVPNAGDITGLWVTIKNRAAAMEFGRYEAFIDRVLCQGEGVNEDGDSDDVAPGECANKKPRRVDRILRQRRRTLLAPYHGVDTYNFLRAATEAFLLMECGVFLDENTDNPAGLEDYRFGQPIDMAKASEYLSGYLQDYMGIRVLPYLKRIVEGAIRGEPLIDSPYCFGVLRSRLSCPCLIELIWSYWLEEGMLVQSMNALSLRFQNRRSGAGEKDPLAHLELDTLRPLGNLLWGYLQDESHRLTVARRAYEYDHHYGIRLVGKAVPQFASVDSRSRFLEAFHTLLNRAAAFFKEEANTMVIPDGFPLLNALQEVHLLLAEGMHNQYGDLPWTARVEMLIMQWLLARPEIKDFLRGRPSVPYSEGWMGQVDAMKTQQGWSPSSITHFRNLAVFGEQVLLSVRFGSWNDEVSGDVAKAWAHYWKPEIQGYIHAYRAVTGVDLGTEPVSSVMPGLLLRDRLASASATGSRTNG